MTNATELVRRRLIPLLSLLMSACAADGAVSLPPARDDGWFVDGESSLRVRPGTAGTVLKVTDADISSIDIATGRARWQQPLPALTSFVQVWEGERYSVQSSGAASEPGGVRQEQFVIGDIRSGRTLRGGAAPNPELFYLFLFTGSAGLGLVSSTTLETTLLGIDGSADTVRWTKRFTTPACSRRSSCEYLTPYGTIGSTVFFRTFGGATLEGNGADALWRIEANGLATSVQMPSTAEDATPYQHLAQTSTVEPLILLAGATSVRAIDTETLALRWRTPTATLIPPRSNSTVTLVGASEEPAERSLRLAYAIVDTVRKTQSVEGLVLRTVDGVVLRRTSLTVSSSDKVIYAGLCGTEGYTIVEANGTIHFSRWDTGRTSSWRSSKLERSMEQYVAEGLLNQRVESTGASTLVLHLPRTGQALGVSCEPR